MRFLNVFYFCGSFLPCWIRIQSGSETLSLTVALFPQDEEEYNEDIPNPTPAMREVMKKRRSMAVTPVKAVQRIPDPIRSVTVGCF
jgi:hypothetical protein